MAGPAQKSTRRSAASSGQPEVTFFIDRSLGKHVVPEALRAAGALVEIHDDHFAPDTADDVWLRSVAQRGWVVLTKDKAIRYRKNEKAAVVAASGRLFVVTAGNITGAEIAAAFVRALPRIHRLLWNQPPPFIATVSASGVVSLLA
jgi:predicted nuclease of predicted toxin-antitoxin system